MGIYLFYHNAMDAYKKTFDHSAHKAHNRAFTLIELSIVLVIIGLIVGGVLVGRDLVKAAEIRKQVAQIEKFDQAVNTFRVKYNFLPGDIPAVTAAQFNLQSDCVRSDAITPCGNGNGIIEDFAGYYPINYIAGEPSYFFVHLSQLNLIDQKIIRGNNGDYVIGSNFPAAIMRGGIMPTGSSNGGLYYFLGINISNTSNVFNLNSVSTTGILSPSEASAIDNKMDDGKPVTGRIFSAMISSVPPNQVVADTNNNNCITNTADNNYYYVSSLTNCKLMIRSAAGY